MEEDNSDDGKVIFYVWKSVIEILIPHIFLHVGEPERKKRKLKEPTQEDAKIRCCCWQVHASYYCPQNNCPFSCKDPKTGMQYPIGDCPVCQCVCNKVVRVADYHKVVSRKMEDCTYSKSEKDSARDFMDGANQVKRTAKEVGTKYYKSKQKRGLLDATDEDIEASVNRQASFMKARHITNNPMSQQVRGEYKKKMKVCL